MVTPTSKTQKDFNHARRGEHSAHGEDPTGAGTSARGGSVPAGGSPTTHVIVNPNTLVSRVSVKVPPFWSDHPEIWFAQIEAQFVIAGITADDTKYNTVLAAIESNILAQIADAVLQPPRSGKYSHLKKCIIDRFCESEQKKIQKLLSDMDLGDRRPTQLLNELSGLAKNRVSDDFLKSLWLQRLPQQARAILQASNVELPELAKLADKILEVSDYRQIAAATAPNIPDESPIGSRIAALEERIEKLCRSRSRNRSSSYSNRNQRPSTPSANNICWYHKTYGENALKCRQPCNYPKN